MLFANEMCIERQNLNEKRISQDKAKPNNYGYKLIDFCKNNNFVILNGRCGKDKHVGKTTSKNCSVIDYILFHAENKMMIKKN